MTIYGLKPRFQSLLRPFSDWLVALGITPNAVTIAALLLSLAEGTALGLYPQETWPLVLLPAVLFVRMALNAIDGMMAREHNMRSTAGQYLNEVGDVVSDLALYIPFLAVLDTPTTLWFMAAFLIGTAASEVTGILATSVGNTRRYDGPMGKSDRAFAIGLLAVSLALFGEHAVVTSAYVGVLCIGVWHTVYRRYRRSVADLSEGGHA